MIEIMRTQMEQQNRIMMKMQEHTDFQNQIRGTSTGRPISSKEAPKLLSSVNLNEFDRWNQRWDDYVICQHLSSQSNETQVAALRSCLDDDLVRFLSQGIIQLPSESVTVVHYLNSIKSYIRTQQNPLLDRIKFFNRNQEVGESFDEYLASVKELKVACDFVIDDNCDTCKTHDEETLRESLACVIQTRDISYWQKATSL